MQKNVVPAKVVPPKPRAVPRESLAGNTGTRTPGAPAPGAGRSVPMVRRVAAGALMTAVVVGSTAGVTLAASRDGAADDPVVVRPSEVTPSEVAPSPSISAKNVQDVVFTGGTTVFTWPTPSATKSTAVRLTDPDQGVVRRTGTATRVAVVWAVAATVAAAGILAGSVLRRH